MIHPRRLVAAMINWVSFHAENFVASGKMGNFVVWHFDTFEGSKLTLLLKEWLRL